tara:strand:+ start:745 stop:1290 length:546 start_codon:yes stop_codon:yes gene_type:complete
MGRVEEEGSMPNTPNMPDGILEEVKSLLEEEEAPFLNHLDKEVNLIWTEKGESRLGFTRFECNHNELFRRRRLKLSPGPIVIALNPILNRDKALYLHTLVHELLHAAGLTDHDGKHSKLVSKIAPAPKLKDSIILRELRQQVLEKLPERQWICGECGHTWDRRRVSTPTRCPKCAKFFKTK